MTGSGYSQTFYALVDHSSSVIGEEDIVKCKVSRWPMHKLGGVIPLVTRKTWANNCEPPSTWRYN